MKRTVPWTVLLIGLLHACATPEPSGTSAPTAPPQQAALQATYAALRASPADQKRALDLAQRAFRDRGGKAERLRLGLLLASLPVPLRDEARAAVLLRPLAEADDAGSAPLALLVVANLDERQRERRDRERREETLRQQLEALRAIERGVLEREERRGRVN